MLPEVWSAILDVDVSDLDEASVRRAAKAALLRHHPDKSSMRTMDPDVILEARQAAICWLRDLDCATDMEIDEA